MGYQKTVWDEQTPITPSRLNKLERQFDEVLSGYVCVGSQTNDIMTEKTNGYEAVEFESIGSYYNLAPPPLADLFIPTTILRWDTKSNALGWKRFAQFITIELGGFWFYIAGPSDPIALPYKIRLTVEFPSLGKGPFVLYDSSDYESGKKTLSVNFQPSQYVDYSSNTNMEIQLSVSSNTAATTRLRAEYNYLRAKCNSTLMLVPKG